MTPLLPENVVRRRLPVNFRQADSALFDHELERVIPQTRLLELRDVRVSAGGILFTGRKILPESFAFPSHLDDWTKASRVKFLSSNYLLKKRRRFESDAVWVVDDWSYGYFHWLADALTRLFAVRDWLSDLVLLLPHQYKTLEFVRPSVEPFGVREIEFIDEDETLVCERLIVPTHTAPSGHYNEKMIGGVRDLLVGFYGGAPEVEPADRIYLSRSRAPKRKIVNEEEVIEVLRAFDFRVIHSEDHSFAEQVKIASGARYLISNHGAGLTNMLFMRPGGNVFELRHHQDCVNNCYFTLASALSLNYFYQTCIPVTFDEDPHTANLLVDVAELSRNVELMLGQSTDGP